MTAFEHLDLLRAHVERRALELTVFLPPDAGMLEARRRGEPGLYVTWDQEASCYQWVDGPDAGARVGSNAAQAAEQIERALLG